MLGLISGLTGGGAIDRQIAHHEPPIMIHVKAGDVVMGALPVDRAAGADEFPRHTVTVRHDFLIAQYPVTVREYARFIAATNYQSGASCRIPGPEGWRTTRDGAWNNPGFLQSEDHPVVCVSWRDAQAYISWLNSLSNRQHRYRLPTESEWALAARAGEDGDNFWGNDPSAGCAFANVNDISAKNKSVKLAEPCEDGFLYTSPVGAFRPNRFNLYDIQGNSWEWVQDCWYGSYEGRPLDGAAFQHGTVCEYRVARGGSWYDTPGPHRLEAREHRNETDALAFIGFRLAADAPGGPD